MPQIQKRFPSQKPRKQKGRGRTYLIIGALILIIAISVGVYLFERGSKATGDFTISAPLAITIRTSQPTVSTITVTAANGFRGTVKLTASAPTNVTATINPVNITGAGTATLTMTATYPGNYTMTVTGTSGTLAHSVTPIVATPLYATFLVNTGSMNGTIEAELYRAQTPKTVSNFVNLVQTGFYSNLVWHRITAIPPATSASIIQSGDPYTKNGGGNRTAPGCCVWGTGGSSQTVPLEVGRGLLNTAGTLGMARGSDPNSGTSQFYINVVSNPGIDPSSNPPGYTVFGKVISGMTLVQAIANHPVSGEVPLDPLPFLIGVTISNTP